MPVGSKLVALLSAAFPLRSFTAFRLARRSSQQLAAFSSVTVFRVRHGFTFTRPYLGFWRDDTNQFCTEALANEGRAEVTTSLPDAKNSHPWPEWPVLANLLLEKGYADKCITSGDDDDSFLVDGDLPEEFLMAVKACLGFARDRPDILRLLSKKNIEALVLNGSPFLFKNGVNSVGRLNIFITGEKNNELESENAQTIDIMRYLLSYVYGSMSSSDASNLNSDNFIERSVRKLLCELFNLSGTFWKPRSVDTVFVELPISKGQLSGHLGQCIETKSGDQISPKIPDRSSASENQNSDWNNFNDKDHGSHMAVQKQDLEATRSLQNGGWNTSNGGFLAHSAQPSTSVLEKNVEFFNRSQTIRASNGQTLNETTVIHTSAYNGYYDGYNGKPAYSSSNSWANNTTTYEKDYSSYNGHNVKSTQPYGNSSSNNSAWGNPDNSFARYSNVPVSSSQPLNNSGNTHQANSNNNSACHGVPTANSSQPSSSSWGNPNNSFEGYRNAPVSSSQPSSSSWGNPNYSFEGYRNAPVGSSQPLNNSENTYRINSSSNNTCYSVPTVNSSQTSNGSWGNPNTCYSVPTVNSSQTSNGSRGNSNNSFAGYSNAPVSSSQPLNNSWSTHQFNYPTRHDVYNPESKQTFVNSWSNNNASHASNTSQPPNASHGEINKTHQWQNRNTPYNTSTTESLPPSHDLYNSTSFDVGAMKSTQWNNKNTNSWTNPVEISKSSNYTGFNADSNHGYSANSTLSSDYSSSNGRTNPGFSTNLAGNSGKESSNNEFCQANNTSVNENYGYSSKSLEGSCVKETDPLDMSEEAKAERWFRRAAQIKDISELSQIPDEDFPQIMPMRKGVNRFVVSKRKTPLERRLASQQYKRTMPVVSSEPEEEQISGIKKSDPLSDS